MTTFKRVIALSGGMLLAAAGVVQADAAQGTDVQTELSALRTRVAQLEGQQNQSWLNEQRAQEVKSLVREVLSDADTRASMAEGGITAGYNNGFFLGSEDGKFLLQLAGQVQFGYFYNAREGTQLAGQDKNDGFFYNPVARLFFDGHVGDPRIQYHVQLVGNAGGGLNIEEATLSYKVADGLTVYGGHQFTPLLRSTTADNRYFLMQDQGAFENNFSIGRQNGIGLVYDVSDSLRTDVMFVDSTTTEYGVAARANLKLAGEWSSLKDFSSWSDEAESFIVGLGVAYTEGEHGIYAQPFNYNAAAVLDATYKNNGFGLYAAAAAQGFKNAVASDQVYGLTAQASYFVVADKFEPYVRYDYIDTSRVLNATDLNLATVGFNYYLNRHNAKFTVDLQYAPRGLHGGFGGITTGTLADRPGNRNQVALRGQFQLLW